MQNKGRRLIAQLKARVLETMAGMAERQASGLGAGFQGGPSEKRWAGKLASLWWHSRTYRQEEPHVEV